MFLTNKRKTTDLGENIVFCLIMLGYYQKILNLYVFAFANHTENQRASYLAKVSQSVTSRGTLTSL